VAVHSTVPTAKAALVTLIGAQLTGVQVTYGRPADSQLERECVWVGDVTGQQRVPTMMAGRKHRQEDYSVEVVCWVADTRGLVSAAEARCFELLGEVEDVVADDPTLGLATNVGFFQATAGTFDTASDLIGGPAAVIRLAIDCSARLV
jgi:hypothetical protein